MYQALAIAALRPDDPEHVVETVSRLRRAHPKLSGEELARKLTARTAWTCAGVGAVSGSVTVQALALDRLLLSIARASGRPANSLERAAAAAASVLAAGAAEGARRQARRAARLLPQGRFAMLPALAEVLVGGAIGFAAAGLLGLAARRYIFERKRWSL
jgi:hypothetical protein